MTKTFRTTVTATTEESGVKVGDILIDELGAPQVEHVTPYGGAWHVSGTTRGGIPWEDSFRVGETTRVDRTQAETEM